MIVENNIIKIFNTDKQKKSNSKKFYIYIFLKFSKKFIDLLCFFFILEEIGTRIIS